jgi:hypothetical protein
MSKSSFAVRQGWPEVPLDKSFNLVFRNQKPPSKFHAGNSATCDPLAQCYWLDSNDCCSLIDSYEFPHYSFLV